MPDVFSPLWHRFGSRPTRTVEELKALLEPQSFELPEETRFAGHWIIAPPGRGKTTLLHTMVVDDLQKDAAVVLIDSKGDLIDPIRGLQSIKDRLLLIEPSPESAFALNPLDVSHASVVQVVSLIEYIMAGLLDAKFTALQSTLFRNVVPAIIEAIPNPTLGAFKNVMVKGLTDLNKVSPQAREFFENRETGFYSKTYESTRKEVVWRLDYPSPGAVGPASRPAAARYWRSCGYPINRSRGWRTGSIILPCGARPYALYRCSGDNRRGVERCRLSCSYERRPVATCRDKPRQRLHPDDR